MKVAAIMKRGVKKDFWDIAELLQHYSIQDFIDLYSKKYPSHKGIPGLGNNQYVLAGDVTGHRPYWLTPPTTKRCSDTLKLSSMPSVHEKRAPIDHGYPFCYYSHKSSAHPLRLNVTIIPI